MQNTVDLLSQYWLLLYATKDTRLSSCDIAVLAEISNNFVKSRNKTYPVGNHQLVRETGYSDGAVQKARRNLVKLGYIEIIEPGKGTRGTVYAPAYSWARSVGESVNAEIKVRSKAKFASDSKKRHTADVGVEVLENAALDGAVGQKKPPLRDLVVPPSATNTYLVSYGNLSYQTPAQPLTPIGPPRAGFELCTILSACRFEEDDELWLTVSFVSASAKTLMIEFLLESPSAERQAEARVELTPFLDALGVTQSEDYADLVGRRFLKRGDDFLPAPANDNQKLGEAA